MGARSLALLLLARHSATAPMTRRAKPINAIGDLEPERHSFWGLTGPQDLSLPANNCTFCFAAGNFIMAAGASLQPQPTCGAPHPQLRNLSAFSQAQSKVAAQLMAAPKGRRALMFNGGAPCGRHHPDDNLWAKLGAANKCRTPAGAPLNWSGIWWDSGINQLAKDWGDSLAALKATGGEFDILSIDTECDTFDAFGVTAVQQHCESRAMLLHGPRHLRVFSESDVLRRPPVHQQGVLSAVLRHSPERPAVPPCPCRAQGQGLRRQWIDERATLAVGLADLVLRSELQREPCGVDERHGRADGRLQEQGLLRAGEEDQPRRRVRGL